MRKLSFGALLTVIALGFGCTRESTRLAIEGYQRADEVRTAAVEDLRGAVRQAIFVNVMNRLAVNPDNRDTILTEAFQNRDRLEFLLNQIDRANTVELVTVYAKLTNDQGILNLLLGTVKQKFDRVEKHIINKLAADAGAGIFGEPTDGE